MAEFKTLSEAATAWLDSALKPIEQFHAEHGSEYDGVTVKFTWREQEYEVGLRKLSSAQ